MKPKSLSSIIPFILLILALSTTFYDGNMIRVFLFCFSVFLVCPISKLYDNNTLLISCYSILYGIFSFINGEVLSASGLLYIIVPGVLFYLFGKYVGILNYDKREKIIWFYLIVILSFASNIYYHLLFNIQNVGSIVNTERVMVSSQQDSIASATMIGLYVSLGLSCLPAFIFDSGWKLSRWVSLLIFTFSILSVVFLINRTGVFITIAVTLIAYIYISKTTSYKVVTKFILILIAVLICYFLFGENLSVIETAYSDRNVDLSTGGDRFNRWLEAIHNLFSSPLGWSSRAKYAHNMWLDVARVSGVIPFVLLIIITYRYYNILKQFCKISNDKHFNMIFISIFTCFMCTCFVEPVVQGEIMYLNLILMSLGVMVGLYNSNLHECNARNRQ